jgi:hypothetical protein
MKKLLFLLTPLFVYAQSSILSDIPLPKTYVQNLDPYECDNSCLQEYLDNGMIFSFLAHANKKLEDEELVEERNIYTSLLNIKSFNSGATVKIALLLPYKRIGKYASSTMNASFAYLMTKTNPYILKSYKIENEESESIEAALQQIEEDGFHYVIAPMTRKGGQNLIDLAPSQIVYFPTLHNRDMNSNAANLYFGAIDYEAQSDLLLQKAVSPLVIFSDKSQTGQKLAHYQEERFFEQAPSNRVIKYSISRKTTNLERYLKKNRRITYASFFINTPVIKSAMILSQLTLYDTKPRNILSTQINYNPLILSMTQYGDRKKMIVANSIIEENDFVTETNSLLANDIKYDWINYATTVGTDYFYNQITGEERDYNIPLQNHQMVYQVELLKPGYSNFLPY